MTTLHKKEGIMAAVARHILMAVCLLGFDATAGSISARVTQIRVDDDGRGMVSFEQPLSAPQATCIHPHLSGPEALIG